ncbi:MAG: DEAD/DEAH box helicase [Proteobacteria bacterium]|nr:DEAD/DEAH box helicase [Pseudomonadota bacterium]
MTSGFEQLGLSEATLSALQEKGFETPSPIQEKVIPLLLDGKQDILGQAQTGTGKTAAFGIPLIERLELKSNYVQALILTPTRELALQVAKEIDSLQDRRRLKITAVYGGQPISEQLRELRRGADIVVGTPGRVIDHIQRRSLKLKDIRYLILDEADEMLNMGFIDDVEKIMENAGDEHNTLLFSATMPRVLLDIADRHMVNKVHVSVKQTQMTTDLTTQVYFELKPGDRFDALCRIIDISVDFYGMVFCKTKLDVDAVVSKFNERGYMAEGLHGDISQMNREKVLQRFRQKRVKILVATDVAARGIDVNDMNHVINYSLPQSPESYVHRVGRTGRAGKKGTAITFIQPSESSKIRFFMKITKSNIERGTLPGVDELIQMKTKRLQDNLGQLMESDQKQTFLNTAKELLAENNPEKLVASLLQVGFKEQIDPRHYREIHQIKSKGREFQNSRDRFNSRGDRSQKQNNYRNSNGRLFVAKGKADEYTPARILSLIKKKSMVDTSKIGAIEIYDKFSFVNVPSDLVDNILSAFRTKGRGRRPLIERAK